MKRSDIPDIISFLLILMFGYAAVSKLMDFDKYRLEMYRQTVPRWSVDWLIYAVPILEITGIVLLLFKRSKTTGLYLAAALMSIFTAYIVLAMNGALGKVPCSCGGIINHLTWQQHFIFNLIFLALSIYGILIDYKERRFIGR